MFNFYQIKCKIKKYILFICFLYINACTFQTHKQCINENFESDYMCFKSELFKDVTISYYHECELSQLNAILEKEIKKLSKEDNDALIAFYTPSHSFYLGMTHKGNGHLYIPVSQTKLAAIKIYDSCDDTSIFIPHQASICIKDINQDGLLDIDIKFNLHHLNGKVYCINRFFLQKENVFYEKIK